MKKLEKLEDRIINIEEMATSYNMVTDALIESKDNYADQEDVERTINFMMKKALNFEEALKDLQSFAEPRSRHQLICAKDGEVYQVINGLNDVPVIASGVEDFKEFSDNYLLGLDEGYFIAEHNTSHHTQEYVFEYSGQLAFAESTMDDFREEKGIK